MGRDCGERAVICGRFSPFAPSYSADNAAQSCDNHVSLAHLLKARLCFEHSTYLHAWGEITRNMMSFAHRLSSFQTIFQRPQTRAQGPSRANCIQFLGLVNYSSKELHIYMHGDRISPISRASFGKFVSFSDISQNRNVERKDVGDTMQAHSC